ncbi:hypothetical protein Slin15195_G088400 [Septoria linicola]|uniref:Uncharacterized protein n=1 Tax=Septoria linicola TaxID=215465 RepID=A0A9Q9B1F8_9PEZI|nr:hypothetical protein Slin15195_G088400 [Septoria linicola]
MADPTRLRSLFERFINASDDQKEALKLHLIEGLVLPNHNVHNAPLTLPATSVPDAASRLLAQVETQPPPGKSSPPSQSTPPSILGGSDREVLHGVRPKKKTWQIIIDTAELRNILTD